MADFAKRQRNTEASVYVGNLDDACSEDILSELFVQCGPVVNVFMPKDKLTGMHSGYGFVEFRSQEDAEYASRVMNMLKLYGKNIKVNKSSMDKKALEIGANIFIKNLDEMIDEKTLYDTFSSFGVVLNGPKVQRDDETGKSLGMAFIGFDSFEASDLAIEAMNNQFFGNRQISVTYAFKKGSGKKEQHGSAAERLLAKQLKERNKDLVAQSVRPNTRFAKTGTPLDVRESVKSPHRQQQAIPLSPPPPQSYGRPGPPPPVMYGARNPLVQQPPPPRMLPQQPPPLMMTPPPLPSLPGSSGVWGPPMPMQRAPMHMQGAPMHGHGPPMHMQGTPMHMQRPAMHMQGPPRPMVGNAPPPLPPPQNNNGHAAAP